jgi:uncharacterized protein
MEQLVHGIKLACNYLLEAEELLKEEKVQFDYFKFPSFEVNHREGDLQEFFMRIERIRNIKPILYHGIYPNKINICNENFSKQFDTKIFQIVCDKTLTPGISLHLDGAGETISRAKLIKTTIDNALFLKQHYPHLQFISLENCEHCSNPFVFDPRFITEIINKTNLFFLLDISHANWSADTRGEILREYIDQLPLNKIYEIHINGWTKINGQQMAHIKIQNELYGLLKELATNYPVRIVTLEYGRPIDRLGSGCPLVNMENVNPRAKVEVEEQLYRLAELVYG